METADDKEFTTTDGYIALQPKEVQTTLQQLRQTIKKAAPDAEEIISYSMPAFKFHGMLVWFAAWKNHYGIYVPAVLAVFKDKLTDYETTKATVRFPYNKPMPKKLITEIIQYAAQENLRKKMLKEQAEPRKIKK
ncbi:MAG: DUF1801 domain-containing protein [Chitinophagales bacterium]